MHPLFFTILSLLLLCLETTATTANQMTTVVVGDSHGVMKKGSDKERLSLLHFKASLQDPKGCLSTWTAEEDDCCTWSGVTCNNQTGHVTVLDIKSCDLVGEISPSLLNITYLDYLDLSYNYFHGTIPKFIGSMTRLNYLDLSLNSFHGTIPPEFGNLTNLQWLDLYDVGRCRVENIEWLSHLSLLEYLVMDEISLAKANHWVDVILSLPKLSVLVLSGCELSEVMYPFSSSFLNSSSSIELLSLRNNSLTSSMYRWFFPLTSNKLRGLDLSINMLDGIPSYLANLCSLEELYFYDNSAVVKFPDFLNNLSGCASLSLHWLDASGNGFTGSLPDDIHNFTSLTDLLLSHNQLNGTITHKLWELPNLLFLDVSSNYFRGDGISKKIGKSNLTFIDLSSCKLGPRFPKWIQKFKNLTSLTISNTGISDTLPLDFLDTWPSQLRYLNLSSNNISGKVPDLSLNFGNGSAIDLSSNSFHGPISNVSSSVALLNLSRNNFSGGISFLCQLVDGFLLILDLSHNFLHGPIPDCLWHFKELQVLNLEHNSLSGRLPASIGSMIQLEALDLYNNHFSGEFPLSLKNCTSLKSLNLGANKFSDNLPFWIGENLSGLYVLMLKSNNFFGTIPLQLCQLASLQILELSVNHFHGNIPSCLSHLTLMAQQASSQVQDVNSRYSLATYSYNVDHVMIQWQGTEREFIKTNMVLLRSIDLSSNNFTGKFPNEITNLTELIVLNLSTNALHGEIPWEIGQMEKLLTLDLSRNKFSGQMPSTMSQMTALNYLDVSSNKLSGRIPSSTQLQSFDSSRYSGNVGLCGPPLSKTCPGDEESQQVPSVVGKSDEGEDELKIWLYIGEGTGFPTGFWIACGALLLNRRGRLAFFHFYDSFNDWVYVKVVVFFANLKKDRT